jgi:hypothetical protein
VKRAWSLAGVRLVAPRLADDAGIVFGTGPYITEGLPAASSNTSET